MPVFDFQFEVPASLDAVREFHRDTRALQRLTPPPAWVQIHEVEPLGEGSVSSFTIWLGPLPIRWKAVHRNVSPRGFTDVQAEGPMASWEHTHSFIPVADRRTEIHEHIEYQYRRGFYGLVTRVLFSRVNLRLMFMYRKRVTQRALTR